MLVTNLFNRTLPLIRLALAIERTPAGKVRLIVQDPDAAQAGVGVAR